MTRLAVRILHLELLMKSLDIVLHSLDQLCLILADRAPDVRPHEQGVESREDAEHLVGVPRCAELVAETGRDLRLDTVDSLVVSVGRGAIQVLPNAMVAGYTDQCRSAFRRCCVWSNVITWVCPISRKKRNVTHEWPHIKKKKFRIYFKKKS